MRICNKILNIEYLYRLAIQEGEGLGTAYEYFVKIRFLNNLLKDKKIKNILIAGLPEKYGFGLDFFVLAEKLECNIYVIDERKHVLKKLMKNIVSLQKQGLLTLKEIEYEQVQRLEEFEHQGRFDLVLSNCVLQRMDRQARKSYFRLLVDMARCVVIFSPNNGNSAHSRFTGLSSIEKKDIMKLSEGGGNGRDIELKKIGLLDMPPFPPGVRKDLQLNKSSVMLKAASIILSCWHFCELLAPGILKNKFSHIIYLYMMVNNREPN